MTTRTRTKTDEDKEDETSTPLMRIQARPGCSPACGAGGLRGRTALGDCELSRPPAPAAVTRPDLQRIGTVGRWTAGRRPSWFFLYHGLGDTIQFARFLAGSRRPQSVASDDASVPAGDAGLVGGAARERAAGTAARRHRAPAAAEPPRSSRGGPSGHAGQPRSRRHRRLGRRPAGALHHPGRAAANDLLGGHSSRRRPHPIERRRAAATVWTGSACRLRSMPPMRPASAAGRRYAAPADCHVLVGKRRLRVVRGSARERLVAWLLDPLFRHRLPIAWPRRHRHHPLRRARRRRLRLERDRPRRHRHRPGSRRR